MNNRITEVILLANIYIYIYIYFYLKGLPTEKRIYQYINTNDCKHFNGKSPSYLGKVFEVAPARR